MHFSDLGTIAIILALGFAAYTIIVAVLGALRDIPALIVSAKRGVLVVTSLLLLASSALIISFLIHDFGVSYVAQQSSLAMPWYYTAAAFYGGQEGSLLYWALMLSVFSAIFVLHLPTRSRCAGALCDGDADGNRALLPHRALRPSPILLSACLVPSPNGEGLNPLLMDPGMLVHPPMLLMGYMSFSVPFAFAVAALISGKLNSDWLRSIRRWMLASWTIQTAGLLLGAWWAYHVLGWGGYWGWDPVENAALLPWLTATAFLHSTMVQERRGMLKVWNLCLIIASFALSIFGTFEVRSGIISSVHSFAYSDIGCYYFAFLVIVIVFSTAFFLLRLPKLRPEQEFDSVVSREGIFLLNNLLLIGMTFATLWGTIFPLDLRRRSPPDDVGGRSLLRECQWAALRSAGAGDGRWPFAGVAAHVAARPVAQSRRPGAGGSRLCRHPAVAGVRDVAPNIGFAVCAFTAGAILYELWRGMRVRHKHGEAYPVALFRLIQRYRQRYGGYIVHLGLVVLAVGVIGSHFFQTQQDAVLHSGQDMTVSGYQFTFLGNIDAKNPGTETITAQLQVWHDGQLLGYLYPGRTFYSHFANQPASLIPIPNYNLSDFYVLLTDWTGATEASIRIFVNPLTPLVWFGGMLMILGGITCWWPTRRKRIIQTTPQTRRGEGGEDGGRGTLVVARVGSEEGDQAKNGNSATHVAPNPVGARVGRMLGGEPLWSPASHPNLKRPTN